MSNRVRIDGVANVVQQVFASYTQKVVDDINQEAKNVANSSCDELRNIVAPYQIKTGNYNKSWQVTKDSKTSDFVSYKVHNKKYYMLTHLLEFGHVGKNKYGTWGIVNAFPHIINVEKKVQDEFAQKVENILRSGK